MKKIILGLAVAAVAFTACTKNQMDSIPSEPYDSKFISFMPATSLSKSVNDAAIADLKGAEGFEVYAFEKDGHLYFTKPDGATISSQYKWTTDAWDWAEKTEDKKWPVSPDGDAKYPMTFFAAYPSATFKAAFDANYDLAGPYNWVHAITVADDLDAQVDYLAAKYQALKNLGTSVPFNFKHIMSNIKFSVKTPVGFTAYVVGVKIHNLHSEDSYDFFAEKWSKLAVTTPASVGAKHYTHFMSTAAAQQIAGDGTSSKSISATTAANSLKLMPQNYTAAWNLGVDETTEDSFKKAAAEWLATAAPRDPWATYPAAVAALATGAYVELIYALVDNNDVCVVGKIDGKKVNNGGNIEPYAGENRFLRVGYVVDLAKVGGASGWAPGKRYTYTIALGTVDASNGTVLDPTYTQEDGTETTPKEDSGKEPGEPVNPVASDFIGFDVVVSDWSDGVASFE